MSTRSSYSEAVLLAMALPWIVACTPDPATESDSVVPPVAPGPDVVASHSHGEIVLRQVEERLAGQSGTGDLESEEIIERYRRAAEAEVVEHHIDHLIGDPVEALIEKGDYPRIHRAAVLEAFLQERSVDLKETSEAEAKAYYEAHEGLFYRPPRRLAWHIFRRTRDSMKTDAARELLLDVRSRALAGVPFDELAREVSDSETRKSGGRLGWIHRGQLSKRLEEALFALAPGEISEPISVKGGSVIFRVSESVEEKTFPFIDVRSQILTLLEEEKRRRLIAEAVEGLEPPPGSIILEPAELADVLEGNEPEAVVLEVGDSRWTASNFKKMLADLSAGSPGWRKVQPTEAYRSRLHDQLLYIELVGSGWVEDPLRAAGIQRRLLSEGRPLLIDGWLRERMLGLVDTAVAEQEAFYLENRYLYQSPLRLKLKTLSVPAEANAREVMVHLEETREKLMAGTLSFEVAAQQIGADQEDLGWLDFQQLTGLVPKVRTYLLDLESSGYTIPFRQGNRLNLVWIQERENPQQLTFDEAKSRVREDFFARSQQRLYQEVAGVILAEQDYRFFEQTVRRALHLPPNP